MAVDTVKATINGTEYTLTYNGTSGKYEATITAPSGSSYPLAGHYYPVSVTAQDVAGNSVTKDSTDGTLGTSLQLKVKEKVKPIIVITSPGASARLTANTPSIIVEVTDSGSGIDLSTWALKVDGGTAINSGSTGVTQTSIANGYRLTYVPQSALSDGSHSVAINVSDYDGNAATQTSVTFTVDTVAPTLNVTAPAQNLITKETTINVTGTTSDSTSSPVTVAILKDGVDVGAVSVDGGTGAFSKSITGLTNGAHVITITATDAAGKVTTITRNITVDTVAPVISAVTITPNPVDAGATYVISVSVSDA